MDFLQYLVAGAYEALTPTGSTGITAAIKHPTSGDFKDRDAQAALITVEDNDIRFTLQGTPPVAAGAGHLMSAGQSYVIQHPSDVNKFRCIDNVSGSASSVKVTTFFRR